MDDSNMLSHIVYTMAADDLMTQESKASAAMFLNAWNIQYRKGWIVSTVWNFSAFLPVAG